MFDVYEFLCSLGYFVSSINNQKTTLNCTFGRKTTTLSRRLSGHLKKRLIGICKHIDQGTINNSNTTI